MSDNPAEIYGPFLIGLMFCCVLYGVTMAQTVYYYRSYLSDPLYLKIMVGVCMFLDTAHIALICETLHFWYIPCKMPENYGGLPLFQLSFGTSVLVTYALTSIVQGFYIRRVYTLSNRNVWITGILMALSSIQLIGGLVLTVDLFIDTRIASVHGRVSQIGGSLELVSTTVCDLTISAALVYFLRKSRTGFSGTENLINRLIIFSVNVGFFTSVIAVCNLVFWLALPTNFIFAAFHIIISKFYVNSLLVSLNSRKTMRQALQNSRDAVSIPSRELQDIRDGFQTRPTSVAFPLSTFQNRGRPDAKP